MDKLVAIEIAKLCNAKSINDNEEYIMFNCPFSEKLHPKGTDRKPSFGLNFVENVFNCFTCGKKGKVDILPFLLIELYGESEAYSQMIDVINNNRVIEFKIPDKNVDKIKPLPFKILQEFEPLDETIKFITPAMAEEHLIFKNSLTTKLFFAILDGNKNLVSILARRIDSGDRYYVTHIKNMQLPDNKPKKAGVWYGMYDNNISKPLVLVEGERDRVLLRKYYDNVWAALGSQITEQMLQTLSKVSNRHIILFFDNDLAGHKAKKEVSKYLRNTHCLRTIRNYKGCKDPAEACEKGIIKDVLSKNNLEVVL